MLFRVTNNPVRDDNPQLNDIDEFVGLSDKRLKWIFLVYDYESRYRKLPIDQRKEKVAFDLKLPTSKGTKKFTQSVVKMINGEDERTESAIKKFKELIYDEDKDTFESLRIMISNIRNMIRKPTDDALEMVRKTQLSEKLPSLLATKAELARILDIESEQNNDEDPDDDITELSTLDLINDGKI